MLITTVIIIAVLVAVSSRFAATTWFVRANLARHTRSANGVVVGAEPLRHDSSGDRGVLLLHGFGDTPQTVRELAYRLSEEGYGVSVPLLPGHGRTLERFVESTSAQWLGEAEGALVDLRSRHTHIAIVGLSMGGALGAILAAKHQDLRALVLIAPYLSVPNTVRRLARWRSVVGNVLPYFPAMGGRSIHDPEARKANLAYGAVNAMVLAELVATVDRATDALPSVQGPVLMLQSREDNRIPVAAAERAYSRIGSASKQLVWLEGCGHILTVDYQRERVTTETVGFLARAMPAVGVATTG